MRSGTAQLLFVICCFCWTIPVAAQTLHLVIVADVNSNLKESVTADGENIAQLFSDNIPPQQLKIMTFMPRELTPTIIKQKITGLNVGTSDTIVFYYSGHGAYDSEGHFCSITNPNQPNANPNRLYFIEIQAAVEQHQPRLAVYIRDCCFVNVEPRQGATIAGARSDYVPTVVTPLFDNLFFRRDGVVDIMAAEKNYPSWGFFHGGIFTLAFVATLYQAIDTRESWDDIFPKVISGTEANFEWRFTYKEGAALITTSLREIMDGYKNGKYGREHQLRYQDLETRQVPVIEYSRNTPNTSQPPPEVSAGNGNQEQSGQMSEHLSRTSPEMSARSGNREQNEPMDEPMTVESDYRSSCTYVQPFRQCVPLRCRLLFRWKAFYQHYVPHGTNLN